MLFNAVKDQTNIYILKTIGNGEEPTFLHWRREKRHIFLLGVLLFTRDCKQAQKWLHCKDGGGYPAVRLQKRCIGEFQAKTARQRISPIRGVLH
ncbi:hypothetical protein FKM82_027122 [Ascaphus truei]